MKKWRFYSILLIAFAVSGILIHRLVQLQIVKGEYYRALSYGQQKSASFSLAGKRGTIFLKEGEVLAITTQEKYLFVRPVKIKEKEKTAEILSSVLDIDKSFLLEKLNKKTLYEEIKEELSEEEVKKIKELALPEVYISEKNIRKYPYGSFASQIVGFVGGEGKGQYGLEEFYEDVLKPKAVFGAVDFKEGNNESKDGADIILNIDYHIQLAAEQTLKKAKEEWNIKSGQVIALEPETGKILAMANYPGFDPNVYFEEKNFDIFLNAASEKLFEPGSVFKPITIAGALNEGKITPETTYYDEGMVKIGKWVIYNFGKRAYGQRTIREVLEKSINTGAVFAEKQLGHHLFMEYIQKFGFFESTGVDLGNEIFSENKELKKGYEINYSTASFGQGIEITPLQLIRAFCVIANKGKLIKPYVVSRIIKANGEVIEIEPTIIRDNIISSQTASQLTAMLVSVVENGFGKQAKIPGYYIAGKTGTAQIPWASLGISKKGYSEETWQSFIGFFPAFNPRIVLLVKLDNPATKTAEYSAAVLFKEIAQYIINYLEIPPDYEEGED